MLSGTYHFPGQIWSEVVNTVTNQNSQFQIYDDEIYMNLLYSSIYNTYLSLDSANIEMGHSNNISSNYVDFILRENEASISLNNSLSIGAIGQFLIYEKTGILKTGMLTSNSTQIKNGHIQFVVDPADSVQPIKINISGLNTYSNLAQATAAGLITGDLYITGNTLCIVP